MPKSTSKSSRFTGVLKLYLNPFSEVKRIRAPKWAFSLTILVRIASYGPQIDQSHCENRLSHIIRAIIPRSPNTVRVCSKLKTSWKSVVFTNKVGKNSRYFVGVFNKTIIPLALVGYEMIIANTVLGVLSAIYQLISDAHLWNNC